MPPQEQLDTLIKNGENMDDYLEIDLRKIIKNILSKWYWVVIPAAVIGIAVFIYSFLIMPDLFKANSTVIITNPRYVANFVDSYETSNPPKPSEEAIKKLALSDDLMLQLFGKWSAKDKEEKSYQDLRKILSIEASDNDMLYTLSVQSENSREAAELANNWADMVVLKINADFFNYDESLVDQFETQFVAAKIKLDRAQAALLDFVENDPRALMEDRLESIKAEQTQTFLKKRLLKEAKFDSQGVLAQLELESDDSRVDDSYRISYLLLQSKLYSGGSDILLESPMDSFTFSTLSQQELDIMTVSEFRDRLENWISVIDEQIAQLEGEEETYITTINQLESEIQSLDYQEEILDSDYDTFQNTYQILLKKYEEISLTMEDIGAGYAKLASAAAVPEKRLGHNTIQNTLIGGVAGGFLGLAGVVIADWWKTGEEEQKKITSVPPSSP